MKIIFIGFATSYKSTVGRAIAKHLDIPFYDVDALVEQKAGLTVSQIFEKLGEGVFRRLESEVLQALANEQKAVISCGGGSVLSADFVALKQSSTVVWLRVGAKTVRRRLNGSTRPLFDGMTLPQLQQALRQRNQIYKGLYDVAVDTDGKTSKQVTAELLQVLKNL